MARFGLVDAAYGGGNKYRIIWAPSRMVVLTGRDKTMTIPMYGHTGADGKVKMPYIEPVGDFWILEAWRSPYDLCGVATVEEWNANPMLLNTGPFPARGDYMRAETLACSPSDANIQKLITWIEEGGERRPIENFAACEDNLRRSIKDRKDKRDAMLRNVIRPWGGEAFAAAGGSRGTKTILQNAAPRSLPPAGAMKMGRKRVVYEVPQEPW
jgi:hypothetical protein